MATTLEIVFLGLCMFVGEDGVQGRTVVMPHLPTSSTVAVRRGTTCIEPHVTYVLSSEKPKSCAECVETPEGEWMLRLHAGETLSISGIVSEPFTEEGFDVIPSMRKTCPQFVLMNIPPTAVRFEIRMGKLSGEKMDGTGERHGRLALKTNGDVVVSATRGGVSRTMTLSSTTRELSIGNRYENVFRPDKKDRRPLADNHWLAFYQLAAKPTVCDLPDDSSPAAPHPHGSTETTIACSNSQYP